MYVTLKDTISYQMIPEVIMSSTALYAEANLRIAFLNLTGNLKNELLAPEYVLSGLTGKH